MRNPSHHCLVVFALSLVASCPRASAAVVQKINEEQDRILVLLNQAELAAYDDGERVVVEISGRDERFVVSATMLHINPVKQTAVLSLDAADERFARRQNVRFLTVFWNVASSPVITGFGQYHQFPRSFAETKAGYFLEHAESETKVDGATDSATSKLDVAGYQVGLEGYIVFKPDAFGAGFGYERRDATVTTKSEGDEKAKTSATVNLIKPGAWISFMSDLRFGLSYDYALADYTVQGGDGDLTFAYDLGRARLQLLQIAKNHEWGVEYLDRAEFEAEATANIQSPSGTSTLTIANTLKLPAEARLFLRNVSSPVFIWGGSLGFVFSERNDGSGGELEPKPELQEQIRFALDFEHRLGDGDKLDWGLFYDGARVPNLVLVSRTINALGFTLTYQSVVGTGFLAGGTFTALAGNRDLTSEREQIGTGPTAAPLAITERNTGYGASLLAFLRYEFDLDTSGGKNRRR